MRNLEELSGKNPLIADGIISCHSIDNNCMQAFATVRNRVDGPTMRRFYLAMRDHLRNKNFTLYAGLKVSPIFQWYVIFEISSFEFEREFVFFLEYLRQARIMTNPIVSDLTKYHPRLK